MRDGDEKERLTRLILTAAGKEKGDVVFKNARIVDVFSHRIVEGDFTVRDGRIAGIGDYEGRETVDLGGRYVIPGLIDSHVHIESSHVLPGKYTQAVVPHGTTAVVADPHEIANVLGKDGIYLMMEAARDLPLSVFFMIPSCVPATPFETSGARLEAADIDALMDEPSVLGLGEVMNFPAVVSAASSVLDKILTARLRGKVADGHSPLLSGMALNAYAAAGIKTDHECSTVEEMTERIRNGMYVMLREGSAARNLRALLKGVTPENARRCLFCTDDRQPKDLLTSGHIDNHLRIAVAEGLDPITAVRMATLNAAECYGLRERGAIAPGYFADFAVVEDLRDFRVVATYFRGVKTSEEGRCLFETTPVRSERAERSMNVKPFSVEDLKLRLSSDTARVMCLQAMSLFTESVQRTVHRNAEGCFQPRPDQDILKLVVIERHHATGNIGLGLVENYGLRGGAIASTIAHDSHNLIAIGDNDADIHAAARELIRVGGGVTLCREGKTLKTLPLPIAGLLTDEPLEEVARALEEMHQIAFETLGVNRSLDPFMTLSFLALPVIPELKLTDRGLFDVTRFAFTEVSV